MSIYDQLRIRPTILPEGRPKDSETTHIYISLAYGSFITQPSADHSELVRILEEIQVQNSERV